MKIAILPSSSSSIILQPIADPMPLHNEQPVENIHLKSSMIPSISKFPIASIRLRTLILKKHLSTLYTQVTQAEKVDPIFTRMILLNMFQMFQINKLNFRQYLHLHNHPDTFAYKCNVMTQTDHTTIRPKPIPRSPFNKLRTSSEKQNLVSHWPSDDNDSTDDELQKDPPEVILNQSPYTKPTLTLDFEAINLLKN